TLQHRRQVEEREWHARVAPPPDPWIYEKHRPRAHRIALRPASNRPTCPLVLIPPPRRLLSLLWPTLRAAGCMGNQSQKLFALRESVLRRKGASSWEHAGLCWARQAGRPCRSIPWLLASTPR